MFNLPSSFCISTQVNGRQIISYLVVNHIYNYVPWKQAQLKLVGNFIVFTYILQVCFFCFLFFFEKFNSKGLDFLLKNWIIKLYFHLLTFIYRNFRKHFGDTDIFFCKSTGETYNYWWYFTQHERLIKLNGIFNQIFVMEIVFWLFKIL